ncbi:MAG: serine/threonine-protein kinase, partial [Acidobacteriota bacterium]
MFLENRLIGSLLAEKYRIERKIGVGGTGVVYQATHIDLGVPVAVKILRQFLSDPTAEERFRREARATAQLNHPNAVKVFDYGVTKESGLVYIVMEFLDGEDLRARLTREKQLAYADILTILEQICTVIESAHTKGIIHRDLKPDNIILLKDEHGVDIVKVLDFGIAKLSSLTLTSNLTQSGTVVGTPHYMSPEQCRGEEVGPHSDIYSLGVILYEMLAGVLPFTASSAMALALKHIQEAPMPLSQWRADLPVEAEQVVLHALAKEPQHRQQSAQQLAQEFKEAIKVVVKPQTQPLCSATKVTEVLPDAAMDATTAPLVSSNPDSVKPADLYVTRVGNAINAEGSATLDTPPPTQPAATVMLDQAIIELKEKSRLEPEIPKSTVRLPAGLGNAEHIFEELIPHKDYDPLWRSFIYASSGRSLLTGYGPFGGTSLLRCAIARARSELKQADGGEGALLVFNFHIKDETHNYFEIEATDLGLSHEKRTAYLGNVDLDELQARASSNEQSNTSSLMNFSLDNPLGVSFFNTSEKASATEILRQNDYDFSHFIADLNAFFKQQKSGKDLRQIVLRLVKSEHLLSRVIFIIDRIRYLETLETLFRAELFSNNRI